MRQYALAGAVTTLLAASMWLGLSAWAAQKTPTTSPHKRLNLDCSACHVASSFHEIIFDHGDTEFDLNGRHKDLACLQCHNVEDFSQVDANCVSCHQDVHLERLGADCALCHSSLGWTAIKSDDIHLRTDFPLMGRHLLLDCESCHVGQAPTEFTNTPTNCVDCHRIDYMNSTNPSHVAGGFSTACMECHQLAGWRPATMPRHDPFFPIFSGTHRGQWDDCMVCHDQPSNPRVFTCLPCHAHNPTDMNAAHQGVGGYSYASQACYSCHPTGERGAFVDHDAQFFPIYSGAHRNKWNDCSTCHNNPGNKSIFTCLSCHEHNQQRMDDTHLGEVSGYAYTSTACYQCHSNGRKP